MTTQLDPRRTYLVPLPWLAPPLSLNDHEHWRERHRKGAAAKTDAHWAIKAARLPKMPAAAVVLHWRVPNWGRRDLDNMAASLKPAIDALVAAGVVPDDDWRHVVFSASKIHPPQPQQPAAMWLAVSPRDPHVRPEAGGGPCRGSV
jgi:crossover junction endodeoxyribonuclease RusA